MITNGRVVDIRSKVGERLGVPTQQQLQQSSKGGTASNGPEIVQTKALELLKENINMQMGDRASSGSQAGSAGIASSVRSGSANAERGGSDSAAQRIATLRIRVGQGKRALLLKMEFTDTVGDLQTAVASHVSMGKDEFELRTSFPNKAYKDPEETLEAAGLTPNATLILQAS